MKLISLNIQGDNHFDRFLPFIQQEAPDVVCLQEVLREDLPMIESNLGMKCVSHAPMTLFKSALDGSLKTHGLAILTNNPVTDIQTDYYATCGREIGDLVRFEDWPSTVQRVLLSCSITIGDGQFRIGTTHFTWSADGQADDVQRKDISTLFAVLSQFEDIVFCGDFNAPRGREIFDMIAAKYTDNIPREVTTTLDQTLHRAPGLQYVVDGLFSSPAYTVSDSRVVDGLSDHCGVVGEVGRVPSA